MDDKMQKIVSLCKRRGFVYPGSEVYGGLANTWDYGPLGVELKNNIKQLWWDRFVHRRDDIFGLDGGILMNPKVWESSGHTTNFIDILSECKVCHHRFRVDLLEDKKKCPDCGGELTNPKKFVPMFKTFIGAAEDSSSVAYLRPETAQAIFVNFKNIVDSFHPRLPFGIAQIGKSFRNEVTMGNFVFRSLEFEQMEIEYFIQGDDWEKEYEGWKNLMEEWTTGLGINKGRLSWRQHGADELSHYSKRTEDLEYEFPFGRKELYGLAYRTDYDLQQHAKASGADLSYHDLVSAEKFFPHVIEPSLGIERTFLVILNEAYQEINNRVVLSLRPELAPYKAAIFPLLGNKPDIIGAARTIYLNLRKKYMVAWDDRGNIGKRYYSQDEIGTPFCITVDYQTLEDETVTVRDRDSAKQQRLGIDKLERFVENNLKR